MENAYRFSFPIFDNWGLVPKTCQYAYHYLSLILNHRKDILSYSNAIMGELIENVIKYADWKSPIISHLQIAISPDKKKLEFKVSNPIDKKSRHASEVMRLIEFLNTYETANEAYDMQVLMNAEESSRAEENEENAPESQAGLLRVATYIQDKKGKSQLEAEVDGNSVLHIIATVKL